MLSKHLPQALGITSFERTVLTRWCLTFFHALPPSTVYNMPSQAAWCPSPNVCTSSLRWPSVLQANEGTVGSSQFQLDKIVHRSKSGVAHRLTPMVNFLSFSLSLPPSLSLSLFSLLSLSLSLALTLSRALSLTLALSISLALAL